MALPIWMVCCPTGPCGPDNGLSGAPRPVGHHFAHVVVVVEQGGSPCVQAVSQPAVGDRYRRAHRAAAGGHRDRTHQYETAVSVLGAFYHGVNVVQATEVHGRLERHLEGAAGIGSSRVEHHGEVLVHRTAVVDGVRSVCTIHVASAVDQVSSTLALAGSPEPEMVIGVPATPWSGDTSRIPMLLLG